MSVEDHDLPECLVTSVGLRCPVFARGTSPRERIESLEEHMLLSAYTQGDLTEERLDWMARLVPVERDWDAVIVSKEDLRSRTEKAVTAAKAQLRPDLYRAKTDAEWMIARLSEEIDRMEKDAARCSRAYTMISGN